MTHVMDPSGRDHEVTPAEERHAIERQFPGWHVWVSDAGHPWATRATESSGVTLDAPGIGLMPFVIAEYEHRQERDRVAAWDERGAALA